MLKYVILFYFLLNTLLFLVDLYSQFYNFELLSNYVPSGDKNDNLPMDPVRWWPSGVPQGMSIIGTALATFGVLSRMPGVSPRIRVLGALGGAGVTATQVTYHSAVENSVGFNRLMWGVSEYSKTGAWPSLDKIASDTTDSTIKDFTTEALKHADNTTVDSIVKEVSGTNGNGFVSFSDSDFSDIINKLIDFLFKETMQLLKPVEVQGHLDDLIGQRMFIETILFIMCISIVLLFIYFILNVIFLLNKDKIVNKFNNKFITFYIQYQAFFSRISLIYTPILIIMSLITLCHGLHWLITNQIPYESLEIDLHKFVSSSDSSISSGTTC